MTLHQLFLLIAVADHQSISGAATSLNMAQPTITYQIRLLEKELSHPLLERKPRGVSLTPEGLVVVQEARKIFELVSNIPNKLSADDTVPRGEVSIGMSPVSPVSTYHFPKFYRPFRARYPGIHLAVREHQTTELTEQIRTHQLDMAIVALPVTGWQLTMEPLWKEKLVVIFPPDMTAKESYHLEELQAYRFVMLKAPFSLARSIAIMTQTAGFIPQIAVEVSTMGALIGLVSAGIGISIVPWESIQTWVAFDAIKVADLTPAQTRTMALIGSKTRKPSLAMELLAKEIRRYAQALDANQDS